MAQKPKIQPGDKLTLEVEVMDTWEDGAKVTFTIGDYPGRVTISAESKAIVKVIPTAKIRKDMRRG